ncbi:MAG: FAD-dependent oxidoreductase, partial [Deltaproteobacteria bacterium]|nr:FAD-dependent oxidoreductase [Deltaproteobacteria bacterium]
ILQLVKLTGGKMPGIKIISGRRFMARFPTRIRRMTRRSLERRDIEILEQGYVKEIKSGAVTMESGQQHTFDLIFLALGVKPSPVFEKSGLPVGPDGGLLVNRYLQSDSYPEIFGGGDCIYFTEQPLDKVGVYAVRENPVLFNNLMAALEGKELEPFDPGGDYLLIFNLGGNKGILRKSFITFGGNIAFKIKDYIDRKFMRKFQSIE